MSDGEPNRNSRLIDFGTIGVRWLLGALFILYRFGESVGPGGLPEIGSSI